MPALLIQYRDGTAIAHCADCFAPLRLAPDGLVEASHGPVDFRCEKCARVWDDKTGSRGKVRSASTR